MIFKDIVVYVLYLDACQKFFLRNPSRILNVFETYRISYLLAFRNFKMRDEDVIQWKEFYDAVLEPLIMEGILEIIQVFKDKTPPFIAMALVYQEKYLKAIQEKGNDVVVPSEIIQERKRYLREITSVASEYRHRICTTSYSNLADEITTEPLDVITIASKAHSTGQIKHNMKEHICTSPWFDDAVNNVPKCQVDHILNQIKTKVKVLPCNTKDELEIRRNIVIQFSIIKVCNYCRNNLSSKDALTCKKCHLVYYCDRKCQEKDWKSRSHKKWCCDQDAPLEHYASNMLLLNVNQSETLGSLD